MRELEEELKHVLVESLDLEDVNAESIDSDAPLFGDEGLGLDSIDALELAVALSKKYGVTVKADDDSTREVFGSVKTLAAHVAAHRTKPPSSES